MEQEKMTAKTRDFIKVYYGVEIDLETAIELTNILTGIIEVLIKYGAEK